LTAILQSNAERTDIVPRFESRRNKLRKLLRATGADALLVTNFTNVTYLTGFTGDDSYFLVTRSREVLVSDERYTTQLEEECPGLKLEIRAPGAKMIQSVAKLVRRAKVSRLAFESASMTVGFHDRLTAALPKVDSVRADSLVEQLRVIKDRHEIAATRVAIDQARRAFEVIKATLTPDQTEKQVAAELENAMRRFGARGCSFPPIIAAGARSALPHATPTDARIGDSDFVLVDWGACEHFYASDLTRLIVTGKISPKLRKIYRIVLKAQVAAIRAIRPGVTCQRVDGVARSIIAKAGFGQHFGHGLGHGLGLDVHENPRLTRGSDTELKPGMIVTVEPGIYLPGWGGVRIEDDVLVTRDGHEVLSDVGKELEDWVVG